MTDYDLERIKAIAASGLALMREVDEDDDIDIDTLSLDTFSIVAVMSYKTQGGEEREAYAVWSESRRRHVQLGVLHSGLDRLVER